LRPESVCLKLLETPTRTLVRPGEIIALVCSRLMIEERTMDRNESGLERVLKWIVIVILAVVALKIVFSVFAIAWLVGGALLTKVLPIVLLVWLVMKLVQWWRDRNGGPEADAGY
jgi:hypothetical protein